MHACTNSNAERGTRRRRRSRVVSDSVSGHFGLFLSSPLGSMFPERTAFFKRGAPKRARARAVVLGRARRPARLSVAQASARGAATSGASATSVETRASADPCFLFSITVRPVFFLIFGPGRAFLPNILYG